MMEFLIPKTSIFFCNALSLDALISFDTRSPLVPRCVASSVDLPPGAAHKSRTLSSGSIGSVAAGRQALGSCR